MADNYRQTLADAEAGDESAMLCLGEYLQGNINGIPIKDFPINPRESERWLLKLIAVTQDLQMKGSALYNLGTAYEDGDSFPRDISKAKDFYKRAADLGAAYSLSMRCRQIYDELNRRRR